MSIETPASQPQAKRRLDYQAPDFLVPSISLDFRLHPSRTIVTAESTLLKQRPDASELLLLGEDLELLECSHPNHELTPSGLLLKGLSALHPGEPYPLKIVTASAPDKNSALMGLYVSDGAFCTQCEPQGFRRITYAVDRPDVLSKYSTRVTASKQDYPFLLSNGRRVSSGEFVADKLEEFYFLNQRETPLDPPLKQAPQTLHWVQWEDPFPKPSYLFALVAGDFDVLRDRFTTRSGRSVDLELYVHHGNLDRAGWAMESLKSAMRWDEQRFGLEYDGDLYMVVAVDFFVMGAMENKGLNIFNSKYVLARKDTATDLDYVNIESVIGHEYFHNWTGNRVTCRDWFQLSLKEGLTVFRDQEFSSDMGSRSTHRIRAIRTIRGVQFSEDSGPMSHPIRPDVVMQMNNFYTYTVYEKGAEVIRMIHTLLGEAGFQLGMKLYFERHDGTAVTCDDFVQAMQDANPHIDLTQFRRWYGQSGTPFLTITDDYDEPTQTYSLTIEQLTKPTHDQREKQPLHIPVDIQLYHGVTNQIIPLYLQPQPSSQTPPGAESTVLHLTEPRKTFVFERVPIKPILSFLRGFSAPVQFDYHYSDAEMIFLIQHATNEIARWDASRNLLAKYFRLCAGSSSSPLHFPDYAIEAFRQILLDPATDPALAAQILTLPRETEVNELFDQIDPDAIRRYRQYLVEQFSAALGADLAKRYHDLALPSYRVQHDDIAKRDLRNTCLNYLAFHPEHAHLVAQQYREADNMTDALAALSASVAASLPVRDQLLQDFEQKWHHEPLVLDKWFSLNTAVSPPESAIPTIRKLMQHPVFSLNNPNRCYSLLGSFASNNPTAFHSKDGSGYQFLADVLRQLDDINPQTTSRLVDSLIRFRKYDPERQHMMKSHLQSLLEKPNLSSDLAEKLQKALEVETK